jgi:hypothetical protein
MACGARCGVVCCSAMSAGHGYPPGCGYPERGGAGQGRLMGITYLFFGDSTIVRTANTVCNNYS